MSIELKDGMRISLNRQFLGSGNITKEQWDSLRVYLKHEMVADSPEEAEELLNMYMPIKQREHLK